MSGNLNLSSRSLREVPEAIWDIHELTFDKREYELEKISRLNLDDNELTGISPEVAKFRRLKLLSANHNSLVVVAGELFKCGQLKRLSFAHNKLSVLPDELAGHQPEPVQLEHHLATRGLS